METENIKISKLTSYKNNNRKHNDLQIKRIAKSIKEFGFNQPLVIDEENVILVGHGRFYAAETLGLKEVPILRRSGLSEKQKKAYRILDNKLQNDSEWDFDNLAPELEWLEKNDFELEPWGLEDLKLEIPEEEKEVEDDEFEVTDQKYKYIKTGDLIELGPHRLLCGDATNEEAYNELLRGESVDLLVTDPPYNVSYTGKTKESLTIQNDRMSDPEFREFLQASFRPAINALKAGGGYYIWHADSEGYNFRGAILDCGQKVRQCLIWAKNSLVMGRQDYHWQHEPCLYGWKEGAAHNWYADRKQTTLIPFDRPTKSTEHPTMKPVGLIAYLIKNSSKQGQLVLDMFLGSGTTLIAADQLERTCCGMEVDPTYCQVVIDRWEEYCKKAERDAEIKINGEPFVRI